MTSRNPSVISPVPDPDQGRPPLWQYVPISEYRLPATTIQSTFKTRFIKFRKQLRSGKLQTTEPFQQADDLKSLPERLLKQILPATDWQANIGAIEDAIAPWIAAGNQFCPAMFLINPPHSHSNHLLTTWADNKGIAIIDPPKPDRSFADSDIWLNRLEKQEGVWALPHLEKCYLRHAAGLGLVRRLFAQLFSGRLGRGLIACDSWAWAYLSRIFKLTSLSARVPQGFDSERLAEWFYGGLPENRRQRFIFRQADTGRYVIRPAEIQNNKSGASFELSPFLKDLAAYSRGIPGVALAVWQRSLKGQPDTIKAQQEENTDSPQRVPIWVQSLTSMEKPVVPQTASRNHAFVLHSLLLHNGLSVDLLSAVLPQPTEEVEQARFELEMPGLIEACDGIWRVSPAGYPVVREYLKTQGFLTDDF